MTKQNYVVRSVWLSLVMVLFVVPSVAQQREKKSRASLRSTSKGLTLSAPTKTVSSDDSDPVSPEAVLENFYSAINDRNYAVAFSLWETPPSDLKNFSQGFADTVGVKLFVSLPVVVEGAAGSSYASVSTILVSKLQSGRQRVFAGCYTMRKSNLSLAENPNAKGWRIYKATMTAAPDTATLTSLLGKLCSD